MIKKISLIILIFMFLITGCGKEKYFVCTIDLENKEQNYTQNSIYKIYYKNSYVTKIEKEELYKSTDEYILNYFNEYKNLEYSNFKDIYGGYDFNISYKDDQIKIKSFINMENVDIKKMILNGYINEDYIVNNNLTTGGIQYYYKEKGAVCHI